MKDRVSMLAVSGLALLLSSRAAVIGGDYPGPIKRIAATLGLRYERPVQNIRIGEKANATVVDASRLAPHGVSARSDDKVVLTLTGKDTFSLVHSRSGRTLKFTFDAEGNVTPAR
jgi:hypothetical protein